MSNKLKKLSRRATALLLAVLLALTPLPASGWNQHWSPWHGYGCEWRGYHAHDEQGPGYIRGITAGSASCTQVHAKIWYDDYVVMDYSRRFAIASVDGWELDFRYSDHGVPGVSTRLW